ncbi:hypothetical protein [Rhizobium leguminosarum]
MPIFNGFPADCAKAGIPTVPASAKPAPLVAKKRRRLISNDLIIFTSLCGSLRPLQKNTM